MTQNVVLITRPEEDSRDLQYQLSALNIPSAVAPLLSIQPARHDFEWHTLKNYSGVIITSKHTTMYLNPKLREEDIPVFVIGRETLKSLMYRGFHVFAAASGDSVSLHGVLHDYLANQNKPEACRFVHFGGMHISTNFQKNILESDLNVDHVSLYEAAATRELSKENILYLQQDKVHTVLFFSSRSAVIFEQLCEKYDLTQRLRHIQALCLAPSVVKSLDETKWKRIAASAEPNTAAIIASLKDII